MSAKVVVAVGCATRNTAQEHDSCLFLRRLSYAVDNLFQYQFDDTFRLRYVRPDLLDLEPRRTQYILPLALRALFRCHAGHHGHVHLGCDDATSYVGEDKLVEQYLGVAWRHC